MCTRNLTNFQRVQNGPEAHLPTTVNRNHILQSPAKIFGGCMSAIP